MIQTKSHFKSRARTITRKHNAYANGMKLRMRKDGLIEVRPRRGRTARIGFGAALMLCIVSVVGLKMALYISMGPEAYGARVAELSAGAPVERLSAALMTPDPLTVSGAELAVLVLQRIWP